MIIEELKKLYLSYVGCEPQAIEEMPASGSNRRYFRLLGNPTLIGVSGESLEENRAFLYMAEHFKQKGLPVPTIYARSENNMFYLQEDLGDTLLFNAIEKGRQTSIFSEEEKELLRKTMRLLPAIQFAGADGMDFSYCHPQAEFNSRSILWDLNYFKYCFIKNTGIEIDEPCLEKEFTLLCDLLLKENDNSFLYRDFQSRNIMWHNNAPYFIDFQGGRRGPIYYDVASFVGQARAKYSADAVQRMIDAYLESLKRYRSVEREKFMHTLIYFRLFRLLQNFSLRIPNCVKNPTALLFAIICRPGYIMNQ